MGDLLLMGLNMILNLYNERMVLINGWSFVDKFKHYLNLYNEWMVVINGWSIVDGFKHDLKLIQWKDGSN